MDIELNIGDKVRFLNDVGGGIVAGFQKGGIVLVEDEDGFEIPVRQSEVVLVSQSESRFFKTPGKKEESIITTLPEVKKPRKERAPEPPTMEELRIEELKQLYAKENPAELQPVVAETKDVKTKKVEIETEKTETEKIETAKPKLVQVASSVEEYHGLKKASIKPEPIPNTTPETRINLMRQTPEEADRAVEVMQLLHRFNMSMPMTDEWWSLMKELFKGNIGDKSRVMTPLTVVRPENVTIGKRVTVMNGCLMMAAGGITIENDVLIAANVQLISNNHDPYDRIILTCKPVTIREGAWIGAGSTILPGVTIGKHAIIGAASVVTKSIPDYAVAVGNPAKIIKLLDEERFR